MDLETQGSTAIVVNFQGKNENFSKDSIYGVVLDIPVVLNSQFGDQDPGDVKRIRDSIDEGSSENSSNSEKIGGISDKNTDIGIDIDEPGQKTGLSDEETYGNGEALSRVEQENDQSSREGTSRVETKGFGLKTSIVKKDKSKKKECEEKKKSCVIDVRCGNVNKECEVGERVCRICHLSEGLVETKSTSSSMELIQLGCGCKGELGVAHAYCAEAWFKLKGNRVCEICGGMAKNVTGVGDNRFMEEWNERRYVGSSISFPGDGSNGCWRGQPLCNFLMGCLVVAFVLPWFFRVSMFGS